MTIFLSALESGCLADDDLSEQNMLQALPRICETLGAEFTQYLPAFMPVLIARASKQENWVQSGCRCAQVSPCTRCVHGNMRDTNTFLHAPLDTVSPTSGRGRDCG